MINLINSIIPENALYKSNQTISKFASELVRIGNQSKFEQELIDASLAIIALQPSRFNVNSTSITKLKKASSSEAIRLALFYIELKDANQALWNGAEKFLVHSGDILDSLRKINTLHANAGATMLNHHIEYSLEHKMDDSNTLQNRKDLTLKKHRALNSVLTINGQTIILVDNRVLLALANHAFNGVGSSIIQYNNPPSNLSVTPNDARIILIQLYDRVQRIELQYDAQLLLIAENKYDLNFEFNV